MDININVNININIIININIQKLNTYINKTIQRKIMH